jgi:hypothetical protein
MRELGRKQCAAVAEAVNTNCPEALPSDGWLDARLREHGCPDDQLATWRARVMATPLRDLADGTC